MINLIVCTVLLKLSGAMSFLYVLRKGESGERGDSHSFWNRILVMYRNLALVFSSIVLEMDIFAAVNSCDCEKILQLKTDVNESDEVCLQDLLRTL